MENAKKIPKILVIRKGALDDHLIDIYYLDNDKILFDSLQIKKIMEDMAEDLRVQAKEWEKEHA